MCSSTIKILLARNYKYIEAKITSEAISKHIILAKFPEVACPQTPLAAASVLIASLVPSPEASLSLPDTLATDHLQTACYGPELCRDMYLGGNVYSYQLI